MADYGGKWITDMTEREDGCIISVGGFVAKLSETKPNYEEIADELVRHKIFQTSGFSVQNKAAIESALNAADAGGEARGRREAAAEIYRAMLQQYQDYGQISMTNTVTLQWIHWIRHKFILTDADFFPAKEERCQTCFGLGDNSDCPICHGVKTVRDTPNFPAEEGK